MEAVCANHPESEAVAICATCKKSLCASCMIQSAGSIFCSKRCAEVMGKRGEELGKKLAESRRAQGSIVGNILLLAIVAVVIIAILEFFGITSFL